MERIGCRRTLPLLVLAVACAAASGAEERWTLRGYRAFTHQTVRADAAEGIVAHAFVFAELDRARVFVSKLYSDFELTCGCAFEAWPLKAGQADAISTGRGGFILPLVSAGSGNVLVLAGKDRAAVLAEADRRWTDPPLRRDSLRHPPFMDKWDRYCIGVWQRLGDAGKDKVRPDREEFLQWEGRIGLNPQLNVGVESFDMTASDNRTTWQRRYLSKYDVKYQRVEWLFHRPDLYNRNPFLTETLNPHVATRWTYYGERTLAGSPLRAAQTASFLLSLRPTLADPNQMAILDPDGEIGPYDCDLWGLYGPVARREFVRFLRDVRGLSIGDVSLRYTGKPDVIRRWEDVPLADWRDFYGWTDGAVDLAGEWRFMRDDRLEGFARGWSMPEYQDDDWVRLYYPGDTLVYSLVAGGRPLWMRRTAEVGAGRFPERVFLSLAPLSRASVQVFVNGRPVGSLDPRFHTALTFGQFDVTDEVRRAGRLTVALRLAGGDAPNGPVFLTPKPIEPFPTADPRVNAARWDAIEFVDWSIAEAVGSTLRAIRSVEPDRPIKVHAYGLSPWGWKTVSQYGGFSHHTGSGAGWHYTEPKAYGAARGLQDSSEPGGPMGSVRDFKGLWGNLIYMGKNAHDYFISPQSFLDSPQMRAYFEQKLPAIRLMGRANAVISPVGVMRGTLNSKYEGEFARWESWRYGVSPVRGGEMTPLIDEVRIRDGALSCFRAIIDEGTPCWDDAMAASLRAYAESGGTLVLNSLSGVHTFIARHAGAGPALGGVRLAGGPKNASAVAFAAGHADLPGLSGTVRIWERPGIGARSLEPLEGTEIVGRWPDGSAAVTRRAVGKGHVYVCAASTYPREFIAALAAAFGPDTFASVEGGADLLRTLRSNNGCEDLLMVRGLGGKEAVVRWTLPYEPDGIYDPVTGKSVQAEIEGRTAVCRLTIPDWDFVWLAVRRPDPAESFGHWLARQEQMWSGFAADAEAPAAPLFRHLDLNHGWSLVQTDSREKAQALLDADDEAAGLKPTDLIFWDAPGMATRSGAGVVGLYRRTFDLPEPWRAESVFRLGILGAAPDSTVHGFQGPSAIYLNGTKLWEGDRLDRVWLNVTAAVQPAGNRLQIIHEGRGIMPAILLERSPVPESVMDLAGSWRAVSGLNAETETALPGAAKGAFAYRDVAVPAEARDREVWLRAEGNWSFAVVNGRLRYWDVHGVSAFPEAGLLEMDITPDLRFGQVNRIVLGTGAAFQGWRPAELSASRVELALYRPGRWAMDGRGTREALTADELAAVALGADVVRQYPMVHPPLARTPAPAVAPEEAEAPLALPPVLLDLDMRPAAGVVADRGPDALALAVEGNVEPFEEADGRLKGVYLRGESARPGTIIVPEETFRRRVEGKAMTVRVWLKPIAISRGGGSLINWSSYLFGWEIENDRTSAWLSSAPERRLIVETAIVQRRWQCLTLVLDGPRGTLYLNGIPIGAQTWDAPLRGTGARIYIGSVGGSRDFLNAKVSAFTIYAGALSPESVRRLYARERAACLPPAGVFAEDDLFRLAIAPGGLADSADVPAHIECGNGVAESAEDGRPVVSLDGKESYLIVRDHPRAPLLFGPFRMIVDFKPGEGAAGVIFRKHHSLCLALEKDGTLVFDANIGRRNTVRFPKAVTPGEWNRLILQYDGKRVVVSVNGKSVADRAYAGSLAGSAFPLVFFADNTHPRFPAQANLRCGVRELRIAPWNEQEAP